MSVLAKSLHAAMLEFCACDRPCLISLPRHGRPTRLCPRLWDAGVVLHGRTTSSGFLGMLTLRFQQLPCWLPLAAGVLFAVAAQARSFQLLSISQPATKMAQVAEAAAAETLCCAVCCAGCTGCCGGDCCRDCVEGCGLLSCCELLGCLACLSCCCPCCCQSQKQGPPPVVLAQGPAMYPPGCPGYTPEQMMMGPPVYAPQAQVMGYPQGAYR